MASKAVTIGDLIHRVASSCLSNRFPGTYTLDGSDLDASDDDDDPFADFGDAADADADDERTRRTVRAEEGDEEARRLRIWEEAEEEKRSSGGRIPRPSPSAASSGGRIPRPSPSAPPLREAVAPYEAALDDLRRQLQGKQAEVDGLKEKLAAAATRRSNARLHPSKKHHHILAAAPAAEVGAPTAELFVACAEQARAATRAFAAHLLHLLRAAGLDPAAATRSVTKIPVTSPQLAKHALEAHATAVLLGGFEHESFYLDGSLSSLLDPAAFRRERYAQYRDMRGMDPGELLGVLPTCAFGRYAASKFASLLPPRVEEAVLGGDEHKKAVGAGAHPRTPFYGEFLRAAKAVWLLHLLAFALEPPPSHFEAGRGAEFHPEYMESVAGSAPRGGAGGGMVVGFAVAPGFKLCNAAVVRARVYLVPRGSRQ